MESLFGLVGIKLGLTNPIFYKETQGDMFNDKPKLVPSAMFAHDSTGAVALA